MTLLMDEAKLKARCSKARSDMLRRAKPVLWKSGRKQGSLRRPGITALPFTTNELWRRALAQIGPGAVRCLYCVAIGRPATLLDLANYVWDHRVPLARGGSTTLDNLFAVCETCNREKGNLSYEFFIAIMAAVEKWLDAKDRAIFHACLRTHGISQRLRGFHGKKAEPQPQPATSGALALAEEF